jgi:hypothetical protein
MGDFSPDDFGVRRADDWITEAAGGFYHRVEKVLERAGL